MSQPTPSQCRRPGHGKLVQVATSVIPFVESHCVKWDVLRKSLSEQDKHQMSSSLVSPPKNKEDQEKQRTEKTGWFPFCPPPPPPAPAHSLVLQDLVCQVPGLRAAAGAPRQRGPSGHRCRAGRWCFVLLGIRIFPRL